MAGNDWREARRERRARMWQGRQVEFSECPVETQNARGEWVPSIPLPFYGLRKRCSCGRKFWTTEGYRGHYALRHVLDGDCKRCGGTGCAACDARHLETH